MILGGTDLWLEGPGNLSNTYSTLSANLTLALWSDWSRERGKRRGEVIAQFFKNKVSRVTSLCIGKEIFEAQKSITSLLIQVLSTSLVLPSFSFITAWAKEFKHSYLCAWSASQSAWHFSASAAAFLDLDIKKSMLRLNMVVVMRRWAAAQGDLPERALRDPDFLPSSRCLELWLWLRKLSKLR